MAATQIGIGVTDVSTTPQLPLGFEFEEENRDNKDAGVRVWRYVQMTGSAATAGMVVQRVAGEVTWIVETSAASQSAITVAGVAQHDIPQDSYGFVLCRGRGTVTTDGNVAAGNELICGLAAGLVRPFQATADFDRIIGVALAADVGTVGDAWLNVQ